eukprot:2386545-Amphidinium_carterae.1
MLSSEGTGTPFPISVHAKHNQLRQNIGGLTTAGVLLSYPLVAAECMHCFEAGQPTDRVVLSVVCTIFPRQWLS